VLAQALMQEVLAQALMQEVLAQAQQQEVLQEPVVLLVLMLLTVKALPPPF
jgi:hypothetical protein